MRGEGKGEESYKKEKGTKERAGEHERQRSEGESGEKNSKQWYSGVFVSNKESN